MNISRIALLSLGLAVIVAPSCSGKEADLACFESWNTDSTGAKWLTGCSCADWSISGRPTVAGQVEVAQCKSGVVPVQGPNPGGYAASDMVCCEGGGTGVICQCARSTDGVCSGKTSIAVCTTGTDGGKGGSGSQGACEDAEPHTDFASCATDGDCYSGYCKQSCTPGPCCEFATDSVRDEGRSYDCDSDADCASVAPDFVARGGLAQCYRSSNFVKHKVCTFHCSGP